MEQSQTVQALKVIVVGDIGTGKTSYIKRFVDGSYSVHYKSTIGVDFSHKKITLDGSVISLQLWDIAGQERYGSATGNYYRGAQGALVFCDISRKTTWDGIIKWKNDIDNKIRGQDDSFIPSILVISKIDLYKENEPDNNYHRENMEEFCKTHGFIGHMEISTATDTNIQSPLITLAKVMIANLALLPPKDDVQPTTKLQPRYVNKDGCC